jgi:hypothetical protein
MDLASSIISEPTDSARDEILVLVDDRADADDLTRAFTGYPYKVRHRKAATKKEIVGGKSVVVLSKDSQQDVDDARACSEMALENGAKSSRMLSLAGWGSSCPNLREWCINRDIFAAIEWKPEADSGAPPPMSEEKKKAQGQARAAGAAPAESQVKILLRVAAAATLFHDPSDRTYAIVPVDDHSEVHELATNGFRRWLKQRFYEDQDRAPSAQAFQDAIGVLDARAMFEGAEEPVYVRLAATGDKVYVDLGDASRQVVEIDADGWRVISDPPVRFRRPSGLRPLPRPARGGSIDRLKDFVNVVASEYPLLVAWLAAALRGVGPFPVLVLVGEQGSAKSTLARLARLLVDPNVSPLRCEPRDARDLMIAACNSWVVCLDNISVLWGWLSDALCRVATGGGFATRTLYTNDEETFLDAMRPVILTGITDIVSRGDLIDRSLFLHLEVIPEQKRRPERELWKDFEAEAPALLGALLDAVAGGLRRLPEVNLTSLPRMADFALFAEGVCQALGHAPGEFLATYNENRKAANESALADSPLAGAMMELAARHQDWSGTATELLDELRAIVDPQDGRSSGTNRHRLLLLPKSPGALSASLKRLAPQFREAGVDVQFSRAKNTRMISVRQVEPERRSDGASPSSSSSSADGTDVTATGSAMTLGDDPASLDRHPPPPERHEGGASSPIVTGSSPDRHHVPATQANGDKQVARCDDDSDDGDDAIPALSTRGRAGVGYDGMDWTAPPDSRPF